MIGFWRQLRFLLWKGVLTKRRQKFWLCIELLVPLLLYVILALIRTRDFTDSRQQCHYDSKGLPSAGLLPFLHSFLCSLSNECHMSPTTDDEMHSLRNYTGQDESIIVDLLYGSAMQLQQIGKNPALFNEFLQEAVRLIKMLAQIDNSTLPVYRVDEFFLDNSDAVKQLRMIGLSPAVAATLANATVTPFFFYNSFKLMNEYKGADDLFGMLDLPDTVDLLCDEAMFNSSFVLPPKAKLDDTLCEVSPLNLVDLRYRTPSKKVKLKNGGSLDVLDVIALATKFMELYNKQNLKPLLEPLSKLPFNTSMIAAAIFCGKSTPFDISTDGIGNNPSQTSANKELDKIQKNIRDFIASVTPGQDKHDRTYCNDVPLKDDMNCSIMETPVFHQIRPILQGYILVTPNNTVTRKLVDILNRPLKNLAFLRHLIYEYVGIADELQEALYNSDLRAASLNVLQWMKQSFPIGGDTVKQIEFVLEHAFAEPTDPYSFGAVTKMVAQNISAYSPCFLAERFVLVKNETELEQTAMCLSEYQQYFTSLVFNLTDNATSFDAFTSYKIRHLPSLTDGTNAISDSRNAVFSRDKTFNDLKYLTYGFIMLQEAVDRAIIHLRTGANVTLGFFAQQEPYPCTTRDTFKLDNLLGLFAILSFIIPSALLVKNIVHEKELRLKEQMRIMGLGDVVHFISWALISFVINFVSIIAISLVLRFGNLFGYVSLTLTIVVFTLFSLSSIALCLLLSTFFSNANLATAATSLLSFMLFFPYQLQSKMRSQVYATFTLIFPQTTVAYAMQMLAQENDLQQGTWSDVSSMQLSSYDVSMIACMVAFVVETLLFTTLAWYISAVAPGIYGVAQPWYFFLTKRYWFPQKDGTVEAEIADNFDVIPDNDNCEPEPRGQKLAVRISNLSKIYDNGTKALDGLNLRLYESQITALLGHNGAGKTTTMSILSGLYSPSVGTATIYGGDIRTSLRKIRNILGVCPQYNVLFTHLTVAEQLRLFAALKGVRDEFLKEEVETILRSVSLTDKANALAGTLSGGMKRRLSIGIALIGGSKFVILDEPTAGVDVNSRKEIWKLLQQNRAGRTILLSTHHMDEADVLSDRIAILSEGKLVTVGSSVFLKNKFGHALQLTACKMDTSTEYGHITEKLIASSTVPLTCADENDLEVVYSIPITTDSNELETFFVAFDTKLGEYRFSDYGISAPTLQQIFVSLTPQREYIVPKESVSCFSKLKKALCRRAAVDSEQAVLIHDDHNGGGELLAEGDGTASTSLSRSGSTLIATKENVLDPPVLNDNEREKWFGQILAVVACRWNYMRRSKKTLLFEVIAPLLLIFCCELYAVIVNHGGADDFVGSQPPLPLIPALFGKEVSTYLNPWNRDTASYSHKLVDSFTSTPGFGINCIDNPPNLSEWPTCDRSIGGQRFNWTASIENTTSYNEDVICACNELTGWNCTMDDYPLDDMWKTKLNTTDLMWDFSYRNLSQMRMATHSATNSTSAPAPLKYLFEGGYSLGHRNPRAQTQANVALAETGANVFAQGVKQASAELGVNLTISANSTAIDDPFIANMTTAMLVDGLLANLDREENVKIWFNNKLWPSLPTYLSALSTALLRIEAKEDPNSLGLLTFNHPMNKTVSSTFDSVQMQKNVIFRIVIICLVLCVIPAGFTIFLVEDRVCDSYHLQIVSGLKKKTYWMVGYGYDMCVYFACALTILIIYEIFQVETFTFDFGATLSFLFLFMIYGFAAVMWAYVLQRAFSISSLAFTLIAIGNFFVGIVTTLTVIVIEQKMVADPTLKFPHTVCSWVFLLIPSYNLGMSIYRGAFVFEMAQLGERYLKQLNREDLRSQLPLPPLLVWTLMGQFCFVLALHLALATAALIFAESDTLKFIRKREAARTQRVLDLDDRGQDADVELEMSRVGEISDKNTAYPLVVRNLAKSYDRTTLVVRGLSFCVERGECFGLLGLNGAGKTTTFGMLTRKIDAGTGDVSIYGTSVTDGDSACFRQLGYCPQFDALNTRLTAKENLVYFARIRGIPKLHIEGTVNHLLRALHLRPYADTMSCELSGGNRRKLSVAVALISQPPLVFLDEPSAGMDPGSQQFLWKVIDQLRRSGKAVVLTSHSMEECEALCTRIAIMDKGKIRCLGSKQHLKNKFGEGYSLTMKVARADEAKEVASFVKRRFDSANLEAIHCHTVYMHIEREDTTIAGILHVVNEAKAKFAIEDFSLSQSTLDEVFQSLARTEWNTQLPHLNSISTNSTHLSASQTL